MRKETYTQLRSAPVTYLEGVEEEGGGGSGACKMC